ncbi:MAG: sugar transporter ATP-binding protein [Microbacteriaceae bacterium]|jgi:ribose transport system ATP-binding protein|nr:sugar transporter ATP-binding protein [Microbacteriaceae bacterium]HEV7956308.1 sugar ABC transporter ATP-binding protein [Marisediminicola sp.]
MTGDGGAPVVEMRGISKSFGGVKVLKEVNFSLGRGEVHALAGENGAGKSTLMKILQGVYSSDSGEILVDGEVVKITDTFAARAAGVGMVFQEFSLISTLTVAQNIFLAAEPLTRGGLIADRRARAMAAEIFADMGVEVDPGAPISALSTAYWQLTEIAKAIAQDAKVLIMDEPTASLAKHEAEALFELIGRLKARGISIIYISHRMDEIYRIADHITVLRDGAKVLTSALTDVTPAGIVEAIVGRSINANLEWRERPARKDLVPVLKVENLTSGARVRDISFTLHEGEIIGLAGLMGSGRSELVRALFGIDSIEAGSITVAGRAVTIRNPRQAMNQGIALIPEDRRLQGLVLEHSVRDNLTLPLLKRVRSGLLLSARRVTELTAELTKQFSVKVANPAMPVGRLSGGNQQKVVIAKWLGTAPKVLLMDEPTAGVDIGTKSEILDMVRAIADEGKGVVFISSELPELLAVSDRILVLRDGAVVKNLTRSEIPNEEYLQLAVQGA